jgi:hypothetical protein
MFAGKSETTQILADVPAITVGMEHVCLQADYNHYNLVQAGRIRDDSGLKFHIRRNLNLAPECENAKGVKKWTKMSVQELKRLESEDKMCKFCHS